MSKALTWLIGMTGVVAILLVFGFVMFASLVMRAPATSVAEAEGIVVLTGGGGRVEEGIRLLREGRGKRVLITGVNPRTSRGEIARMTDATIEELNCCVDLGYEALNTRGNADEAADWARRRGYRSLLVVTSSYHMPRSLVELTRELPDRDLVPYPVVPSMFRAKEWWLSPTTARVLLSEYAKLLPAAARLAFARVLGHWPSQGVAGRGEEGRAQAESRL